MKDDSDLPCFEKFDFNVLRSRFNENLTDQNVKLFII